MGQRILRRRAVLDRIGLSNTQLWRLEREGQFPARVQLGSNSVGWREAEIEAWIEARGRGAGITPAARRPAAA